MDKKIYQKIIRYEEDKRFLYQKFLEDKTKKSGKINLEFQSDLAKKHFELSLPPYIKRSEEKLFYG